MIDQKERKMEKIRVYSPNTREHIFLFKEMITAVGYDDFKNFYVYANGSRFEITYQNYKDLGGFVDESLKELYERDNG